MIRVKEPPTLTGQLSWLEHRLDRSRLWVPSPSRHIQESTNECINKWNTKSMFLSLPPSLLFLSLSKANKKKKKKKKKERKSPSLVLLSGSHLPNLTWHCRFRWPEDIAYHNPGVLALLTPHWLPGPYCVGEITDLALPHPCFFTQSPGLRWHCSGLPEAWTARWL